MGLLYPPTAPVLTGDVLTINRFLASPVAVQRRLRTLADQRFLAEVILTGRIEATGGADRLRTVRDDLFRPGARPRSLPAASTSGRSPWVAPPHSRRSPNTARTSASSTRPSAASPPPPPTASCQARQPVRQLRRHDLPRGDRRRRHPDAGRRRGMEHGTADPFLDVMLAAAQVEDLGEGYDVDTIVLTSTLYARLVANQKVMSGLARVQQHGHRDRRGHPPRGPRRPAGARLPDARRGLRDGPGLHAARVPRLREHPQPGVHRQPPRRHPDLGSPGPGGPPTPGCCGAASPSCRSSRSPTAP
jgi:hypothetical protein